MSQSLSAHLERAPSFDEIAAELQRFGLCYRHSFTPKTSPRASIHVFGLDDLRVVIYEQDDRRGTTVSTTVRRVGNAIDAARLQIISSRIVRRWGGKIDT